VLGDLRLRLVGGLSRGNPLLLLGLGVVLHLLRLGLVVSDGLALDLLVGLGSLDIAVRSRSISVEGDGADLQEDHEQTKPVEGASYGQHQVVVGLLIAHRLVVSTHDDVEEESENTEEGTHLSCLQGTSSQQSVRLANLVNQSPDVLE